MSFLFWSRKEDKKDEERVNGQDAREVQSNQNGGRREEEEEGLPERQKKLRVMAKSKTTSRLQNLYTELYKTISQQQ